MGFEASYQGVLVCTFILKRLCSPLLPTPSLYISQDQKIKKLEKKNKVGIEPDVNRTRNLLIWSQTRYHCATDPLVISGHQQ